MILNGKIRGESSGLPLLSVIKNVTNNISGGDPIGDALRAACAAYWKFEEADSPWVSSVGGFSIFLNAFGDTLIQSVPGRIGSGIGYTDEPGGNNNASGDTVGTFTDWSWSIWLKQNATNPGGASLALFCDIALYTNGNNDVVIDTGIATSSSYVISAGNWHNLIVVKSGTDHLFYIDGVLKETVNGNADAIDFSPIYLRTAGNNNTDYFHIDENGFFSIVITQEQIDYLYNSGSGKELYP